MKEKKIQEIEKERIIPINIEEELKSSYIDYSMSVIISRALPDIRDGLKPVHRRILYSMYKIGLFSNKQYKKSARIVGEVLGKYHPHGDNSVYDSIVRMAQNWSMRYTLIDGQGNFGSIDNDSPAAMRYTEIRLKKISEEILLDIENNTVGMRLNFDNSLLEPSVLPTKIPNLLINGSSGIAVGMATNIAPHNLKEAIDAICAYIDNNSISIDELMLYIKGPDFPTGGIIYGNKGIIQSFYNGKGKIIIRSKIHKEKINNKNCIIVDELPYQVNKEELIYHTKNLIKEKKIEGINDIKDESGRQGLRIVYILKKETIYKVVLNNLYKYTKLQTSFNINNIALVNGIPKKLNLKEIISNFVNFRHNIIIKRTNYKLEKLNKKIHILSGIIISLSHIDLVIKLIRESDNFKNACKYLINNLKITKIQAKSILEIKLHKLTSLEIKKIKKEFKYSKKEIEKLVNILKNEKIRMDIIKKELIEIKEKYGDERRTKIESLNSNLEEEDFIVNKQVVLTISNIGYIKRTDLSEYKKQMRGGVGKKGVIIREEDYIKKILVAETHQYILFFTEKGKCFWIKVFYIPIGSKKSKGRSIQNLININKNDKIITYVLLKNIKDINYINNHFIVFITKKGKIKRTLLKEYSKPRKNGINAILIKENDILLDAIITNGKKQIIIGTNKGKALRFLESSIKLTKRNSYGIKSISLKKKDFVIGIIYIKNENIENILVVSENGYGKKSSIKDYRLTNRNRIGVQTIKINNKTGNLIYIKNVTDDQDLIIVKKSGIVIRIPINNICLIGRSTQGVKLINLKNNEKIASITTTLK